MAAAAVAADEKEEEEGAKIGVRTCKWCIQLALTVDVSLYKEHLCFRQRK